MERLFLKSNDDIWHCLSEGVFWGIM